MSVKQLPARSEVPVEDTWDLSSLFSSDEAWTEAFEQWQQKIDQYESFQGKLGESAENLARCLEFDADFDREGGTAGDLCVPQNDRGPGKQHLPGHEGKVPGRRQ